jgi:hypothetical protein
MRPHAVTVPRQTLCQADCVPRHVAAAPAARHEHRRALASVRARVQADLAAAATDNELVAEERRRLSAKRDADPVKALTSMAALLGGKIVLVQARARTAVVSVAPSFAILAVPTYDRAMHCARSAAPGLRHQTDPLPLCRACASF